MRGTTRYGSELRVLNKHSATEVANIIRSAKRLARRYYQLTNRPLGVTGEVAEYEAIRLLHLEPAQVRQPGYDAVRRSKNGRVTRLQIKSRSFEPTKPGQRLGGISLTKPWDKVLLVILNRDLEPLNMYEASRRAIEKELRRPGSKARNKRGALAVNQFKRIAVQVWPRSAKNTSF